MMFSSSVKEAHNLATITHLTTIMAGLQFVHFFNGFWASHEINTDKVLNYDTLHRMADEEGIARMLARSIKPEHPSVSVYNTWTRIFFFQASEKAN